MHVDPARRVVVAKLSSWPDPLDEPLRLRTYRAVDAIGRELAGALSVAARTPPRAGPGPRTSAGQATRMRWLARNRSAGSYARFAARSRA